VFPSHDPSARTRTNFITIPHTTIKQQDIHNAFIAYKQTDYIITKTEKHEDGEHHLHIIIKFKQQVKLNSIHKIIMNFNDRTDTNGLINYQTPKNINASIQYLKKEETAIKELPYLEYGQAPKERGRPNKQSIDNSILEVIQLAEQGETEEALELMKQSNPRDYILYKNTIRETLTSENKTRLKYDLPNMDKSNVKLTPSQQKVWDLLQTTPQARRILWITGDYGAGKSFLYNYIKTNHTHGMYDAGQSASLDNTAYGYDEEGVIAWDLPRTYNFQDLGDSIANVIEKFSDFGQPITSKKYSGKTQRVRGHAIVFSNAPPLDQLQHRNIIHINLEKPQEKAEIQKTDKIAKNRDITITKINQKPPILKTRPKPITTINTKPLENESIPITIEPSNMELINITEDIDDQLTDAELLELPMNDEILQHNKPLKQRWARLKLNYNNKLN
jgi:hypothetical protein